MRPVERRSPLLLLLLLGLHSVGCSRDGALPSTPELGEQPSDPDEQELALELPSQCAPGQEEALKADVLEAVSRIRIGRSRADLGLMDQFERKLTAYEACGEAFARLCDAECMAQRAHVHLFRASAIPLLASAGPVAVATSESTMLSEAHKGLVVLARALERLPRQRAFHPSNDATDQEGTAGYNGYLKTYSALLALRAQLQMTAGDIYYRRASSARARAVSFFVGSVLGEAGAAVQGESELAYASMYYEQAYWTLLEAHTGLPGDLAASPLFASELSQVDALGEEVGERLGSLRAGKLYIGVDPSGLQSDQGIGSNTLSELFSQLNRQREELGKVEGQVEGTIKQWAEKAREIADADNAHADALTTHAIDLQVYKMQELEEATENLTKPLEQKLAQLANTQVRFELEAQIEAILLQLQVTKRSFANDLMSLDLQHEEDLLASSLERGQLELDTVQGLIDSTLTQFNFKMQVDDLEREKSGFDQQRTQEELNGRALAEQIRQIDADSAMQRQDITYFDQEKAATRQRKEKVIVQRADALLSNMLALGAELGFYEQQRELLADVCKARSDLATSSAEKLDELAACLRGGACQGLASQRELFERVLSAKRAYHAQSRANAERQRDFIEDSIVAGNRDLRDYTENVDLQTYFRVNMGGLQVAAELVEIGEASGLGVLAQPLKALAAAAETAFDVVALGGERIVNVASFKQAGFEAAARLAEIDQQLDQIDFDKELAEIERDQAIAELDTRLLEVEVQQRIQQGELNVQRIECVEQEGQRLANVDRLRAEMAALQAEIRAEAGEYGALDIVIAQQDTLIGKARANLQKNEAQKAEVAIRMQQASSAAQHYRRSSDAVASQLNEVRNYMSQVATLGAQAGQLQDVMKKHVDEISLVRTRATEQQRQFVLAAMQDANQVAFQAIEALEQQLALNQDLARVTAEIGNIEAQAREKLRGYRDELMKLVALKPTSSANLIWDLENVTAQLTKGAGELLDYKRSLLASTNYYYNAYRYRYNLLSEFVGRGPIPEDQPYIWTSSDAAQKLAQCGALGQTPLCDAKSLASDSSQISFTHATFELDGRSPMLQEFLRKGRAQFEFSEFARNMGESHNLGDFVLWDDQTMDQSEMRVVGFYLSFPTLTCQLTMIDLRHTGLGYQLTPTGASVTMRGPVQGRPVIVTRSNSQNPDGDVISSAGAFSRAPLTVMQLDSKLGGQDGAGTMPFAGYPLRGSFELITRDPPACRDQVDKMNLTVVFAKRLPKS